MTFFTLFNNFFDIIIGVGVKDMKKYIPNFLTLSRLLVTPLIIYLGLNNHLIILIIVAVFIALTDFFDGYLARKWQVTSDFGAKLDMIADKVLALGLLILLIMKNHLFLYVLILESIIANSTWMGITYKEDLEDLVKKINWLIEKGEYPRDLWG